MIPTNFARAIELFHPNPNRGRAARSRLNNGPTERAKPLVALLDRMECSVELEILSDVATVVSCDAQTPKKIPKEIWNGAIGVIMGSRLTLTSNDLMKFRGLNIIVRIGSGVDNINVKAAAELGIAVSNVEEHGAEEVADTTLSLILNLYRRTYWLANSVQEGNNSNHIDQLRAVAAGSSRIRGETLGIVGLGRIGSAVALRAKALGFNVIFYDPKVPDTVEKNLGVTRVDSLQALLFQSHCVSLHCTLNEHNHHLIREDTLRQMIPGAFLVNTARLGLVDEVALAIALAERDIHSAALDVHENEIDKVMQGPLKNAPNFICTASHRKVREMAAMEVRRSLEDLDALPGCLQHCVNKENFIQEEFWFPRT